jgi:uncharacterized protein (DUF433 family)
VQDLVNHHIEKTPGTCGGRARIAGHRVRVMDIVVWHEMRGYAPDEIVAMFPGIALADIHAAPAYYFDNRTEIEEDFRKDEEWAEFGKAHYPSKLKEKLGCGADPLLFRPALALARRAGLAQARNRRSYGPGNRPLRAARSGPIGFRAGFPQRRCHRAHLGGVTALPQAVWVKCG